MSIDTIEKALFALFSEDCPIVFWDDEEGEFTEVLAQLPFEEHGVTLVRRSEIGDLELKMKLELEASPSDRFLLYSTQPVPEPQDDWLLNIRLYSKEFRADSATILVNDLGLSSTSMRGHLVLRKRFFAAQERISRVRKFIRPEFRERDVDMAILAVLTKSNRDSFNEILFRLFAEQYPASGSLLDFFTPLWKEVEKYGLVEFFWAEAKREFGYTGLKKNDGTEERSLRHLLRCLLVTDMANSLGNALPSSLSHFVLDEKLAHIATIFCGEWRRHLSWYRQYAHVTGRVASELGLQEALSTLRAEDFGECSTFEIVERFVAANIIRRLENDSVESLKAVIDSRRGLFWMEWQEDALQLYAEVYNGLEALLEIRRLKEKYANGFHFTDAAEAWKAYTGELYRFDQNYRRFCVAADAVESKADILKVARDLVEKWITEWYHGELAQGWHPILDGEHGLISEWSIPNVPLQKDFYWDRLAPVLQANAKSRVFVIISDGLRYEVAEELNRALNIEQRLKSELSAQLGVLPSITSLGMAALLPHRTLTFKADGVEILVDGLPAASIEQRDAILRKYNGMAIKADDLLAMKTDEARNRVRDARIIYIYHNQIDSIGDNGSSESQTFVAAGEAIDKLKQLVRFVMDRLSGTHIFVTADHGFLFQESALTDISKAIASPKVSGVLKAKKRYILGHNLGEAYGVWHGNLAETAGIENADNIEFWIPRGIGRFHFSGGARYTHGGALPQEFVVPVVSIHTLSGKNLLLDAVKQVEVTPLSISNRVVNNTHKFEFIQTERVTERCLPRSLSVYLSDGNNQISNEVTLIFDSASDDMSQRKKTAKLSLKNRNFDSREKYWLILRDSETLAEYQRISIIIDITFQSLF